MRNQRVSPGSARRCSQSLRSSPDIPAHAAVAPSRPRRPARCTSASPRAARCRTRRPRCPQKRSARSPCPHRPAPARLLPARPSAPHRCRSPARSARSASWPLRPPCAWSPCTAPVRCRSCSSHSAHRPVSRPAVPRLPLRPCPAATPPSAPLRRRAAPAHTPCSRQGRSCPLPAPWPCQRWSRPPSVPAGKGSMLPPHTGFRPQFPQACSGSASSPRPRSPSSAAAPAVRCSSARPRCALPVRPSPAWLPVPSAARSGSPPFPRCFPPAGC